MGCAFAAWALVRFDRPEGATPGRSGVLQGALAKRRNGLKHCEVTYLSWPALSLCAVDFQGFTT